MKTQENNWRVIIRVSGEVLGIVSFPKGINPLLSLKRKKDEIRKMFKDLYPEETITIKVLET